MNVETEGGWFSLPHESPMSSFTLADNLFMLYFPITFSSTDKNFFFSEISKIPDWNNNGKNRIN